MILKSIGVTLLFAALAACGGPDPARPPAVAAPAMHRAEGHGHEHAPGPAEASSGSADATERALDQVAAIHGAAGPWAVAGYRMGDYALGKLGLPRGSFDLEVSHHTPKAVKYSCIADGAAAATGASAGKLNLVLVDADEAHVETTYRRKSTGQSITLRPAASFGTRFADFPREQARVLGKQVLELPAGEVFEEVAAAK